MTIKMLIDAAHPEETRVVVTKGNRIEEFDFESANRRPLRGNIYLAKVVRVEPSLQAAFVDFGGNRHGFLAFSEIHPDYYQIPTSDRQALLDAEAEAVRENDSHDFEEDSSPPPSQRGGDRKRDPQNGEGGNLAIEAQTSDGIETIEGSSTSDLDSSADESDASSPQDNGTQADAEQEDKPPSPRGRTRRSAPFARRGRRGEAEERTAAPEDYVSPPALQTGEVEGLETSSELTTADKAGLDLGEEDARGGETQPSVADFSQNSSDFDDEDGDEPEEIDEIGGGDALEEVPTRNYYRSRRQYKIQEVIKRRQILLVQVVKEERGTKGAALTTYLSMAGRYAVLMPNTARGGGISRKITNAVDRNRLKSMVADLDVPTGMGVILRTAGASRTKVEIKRDFEYLMRLWESVRGLTLDSTAPALVYEEGSLIKRAIRDLFSKDIEEIQVAGDEGYQEARDFMRMLMPSHVKDVHFYKDPTPIFSRFGVESQLDAMFSHVVTLKSGGYLVVNQTEALVSIDVNSGRSTREHNIEDTALKTNLEAAEEVARQLRLRDLAGLVVIDFIDMEEKRNNKAVERKLNDCLKNDRARIQVGRISHFGLLEMSRQRIRAGVVESSTAPCPHCNGSGLLRSTPSLALHVLRALEDLLLRGATHDLVLKTRLETAFYILNQKRDALFALEARFGVAINVLAEAHLPPGQHFQIERGELARARPQVERVLPKAENGPVRGNGGRLTTHSIRAIHPDDVALDDVAEERKEEDLETSEDGAETEENDRPRRRKRRRRGGGGRYAEETSGGDARRGADVQDDEGSETEGQDQASSAEGDKEAGSTSDEADDDATNARRGGGRNRRFRNGRRGRGDSYRSEERAKSFSEEGNIAQEEHVQEADLQVDGIQETGGDLTPSSSMRQENEAPQQNPKERNEGSRYGRRGRRDGEGRGEGRARASQERDYASPPQNEFAGSADTGNQKREMDENLTSVRGENTPELSHVSSGDKVWEKEGTNSHVPSPQEPVKTPPPVVVEEEVDDPSRPKRSGWWKRAKTIFGEG